MSYMNDGITGMVRPAEIGDIETWTGLVAEIAKIDVQETQGALRSGDLLNLAEQRYGRKEAAMAARSAGVNASTAATRLWVSKRIPPGHPLRRYKKLNYSQLRTLAGLEDDERRIQWAERVEEENWTAAALIDALAQAGDQVAQERGTPCVQCPNLLPKDGVVAVSVGKNRRVRCCSIDCAKNYLNEMATRPEPPSPPPDPWA